MRLNKATPHGHLDPSMLVKYNLRPNRKSKSEARQGSATA